MSQAEFDAAAKFLTSSPAASKAPTTKKLEIYALFKAVTVDPQPTTKRPGIFDPTGRAKWDAWKGLKAASVDEHRARYVAIARELGWDGVVPDVAPVPTAASAPSKDNDDEPIDWSDDVAPPPSRGGGMGASVSVMVAETANQTFDRTTLHGCVQAGDVSILALLLQAGGIDVDARDEHGFTALQLAADRGSEAAVKLLLEYGADSTLKDPDGETALSLAEVSNHEAVVQLLQQRQ